MNKQNNCILAVSTLVIIASIIFAGMNTHAIIIWAAIMAIASVISLGMHIAFKILFR